MRRLAPRDIQAEARAAHSALHLHVRAVELFEDPFLAILRNSRPLVGDAERDDALPSLDRDADRATSRVLDALSIRFSSTCRVRAGSASTKASSASTSCTRAVMCRRRASSTTSRAELDRLEALLREQEPLGLEAARHEQILDQPREPLRLLGQRREQQGAVVRREPLTPFAERQRCPYTPVKGVRSSCETVERKSFFICSSRCSSVTLANV